MSLKQCARRAEVLVAGHANAAWLDFYHYGFMRLSALDWIRQARH